MCAVCALGAVAQTTEPAPETIYLVGTFQEIPWTTPLAGGTDITMTDPDGDGIYTRDLEVPAGTLQFKFFTSADGDWDDSSYGTYSSGGYPLYSNVEYTSAVVLNGANFSVTNWNGGTLSISINWNTMEITLAGPDQPEAPEASQLWLIGDFNSWALPTADNANGALSLGEPETNMSGANYFATVGVPSGAREFKIYKLDNNEAGSYLGVDYPEFWLSTWKDTAGELRESGAYMTLINSTASDDNSIKISNWHGGELKVSVSIPYEGAPNIFVNSADAPDSPFADATVYVIQEMDGEKMIKGWNAAECYMSIMTGAGGKDCSVIITTENSLTPAPENCYGVAQDIDLSTLLEDDGVNKQVSLVKGGKPFSYSFKGKGYLNVFVNLGIGVVDVNAELTEPAYDSLEEIYLVGSPQGWSVSDGSIVLKPTEPGVFEGTVHMVDDPNFRFFHTLGAWTSENCFGASLDDFSEVYVYVNEDDWNVTDIVNHGLGNWVVQDWEEGDMQIKVDLNAWKLYLKGNGHAGVEGVTADDSEAEVEYYNLQGVRVAPDASGLYIVRRGGRTEKVFMNR